MNRHAYCLVMLLGASAASDAGNLLQNPGFDTSIEPEWEVDFPTLSGLEFSEMDELGSELSGSALFTDAGEFGRIIDQCVSAGDSTFTAGLSYFIPSDVVFDSPPILFLRYYPVGDCQGSSMGSDNLFPSPVIQGDWTQERWQIMTPSGTRSISVGITFSASGTSNSEVFVDNVLLEEPPLFMDGFED